MTMLRAFWDAAAEIDPAAPDEGRMRWCSPAELRELWEAAGLATVVTAEMVVEASYQGFDDLWQPFTQGVGPAGAFCVSLEPERREALREAYRRLLAAGDEPFSLKARAWFVRGTA
jgi:hypothetical protein